MSSAVIWIDTTCPRLPRDAEEHEACNFFLPRDVCFDMCPDMGRGVWFCSRPDEAHGGDCIAGSVDGRVLARWTRVSASPGETGGI